MRATGAHGEVSVGHHGQWRKGWRRPARMLLSSSLGSEEGGMRTMIKEKFEQVTCEEGDVWSQTGAVGQQGQCGRELKP